MLTALILALAGCNANTGLPMSSTADGNDLAVRSDRGLIMGQPPPDSGSGIVDSGITGLDATMELPCDGRDCGPHAFCDEEHNQCVCEDGFQGSPESGCFPINEPLGWIGSPCNIDNDCNYDGGFCHSGSDFPGGYCSAQCNRLCPDRNDFPVTFCIETSTAQAGECFSRCDTAIYPENGGCRQGYACTAWPRYTEPEIVQNICVPQSWIQSMPCSDPSNHAGNDDCYLDLISDGNLMTREHALALLEGRGNSQTAEAFLDQNHANSESFITNELGRTIHDNYTSGHSTSSPMVGAIVHYTASQREDGTIRYFVSSSPHASSHFVIGSHRNGHIVQIFSHRNRTWHAGQTYNVDRFGIDFANAGYLNARSNGEYEDYAGRQYAMNLPLHGNQPIEVTGGIPGANSKYARKTHWQPYTYYQLLSFILVGRALHELYNLDITKFERHGDVASSRVDPGPHLPLTYLKNAVFSNDNVFTLDWLNQYKAQANWIADHPEAR